MIGFLVCFALWPALHHVLVRHFEMNPWKFFGWSMYCVPATFVHVNAFESHHTMGGQIDLRSLQDAVDAFVHERWVYGTLVTPKRLARPIFDLRPDLAKITIVVDHVGLDKQSGFYARKRFEYPFDAVAQPEGSQPRVMQPGDN